MKKLLKIFGQQQIAKKYALVILYPDKIIIDTLDMVKAGFTIMAANPTILATDVTNQTLGKTVRIHLNSTKYGLKNPSQTEFKTLQQSFLKSYGFTTLKKFHENAKYLSITEQEAEITLEPTKNGGPTGKGKGFSEIPEKSITIAKSMNDAYLGELIKTELHECI